MTHVVAHLNDLLHLEKSRDTELGAGVDLWSWFSLSESVINASVCPCRDGSADAMHCYVLYHSLCEIHDYINGIVCCRALRTGGSVDSSLRFTGVTHLSFFF